MEIIIQFIFTLVVGTSLLLGGYVIYRDTRPKWFGVFMILLGLFVVAVFLTGMFG